MLLYAAIEERTVADATLCNALHAISLVLYATLQFHLRFDELSGGATLAMQGQGCDTRAREGTQPLIHVRCFYIRSQKGQSGPVYG